MGCLNLHNSGLLWAGFFEMSEWSFEREIGHPEADMSIFQFYIGELDQPGVVSTAARSYKTLLGAPPSPRMHPRLAMMPYYLYLCMFPI
jgi:hypothetical protein